MLKEKFGYLPSSFADAISSLYSEVITPTSDMINSSTHSVKNYVVGVGPVLLEIHEGIGLIKMDISSGTLKYSLMPIDGEGYKERLQYLQSVIDNVGLETPKDN